MSRYLPRAIGFAVLALIVWTVASAIVVLVQVGLPSPGADMTDYMARAAGPIRAADLIVGVLTMLTFGWLVARPFSGRGSIEAAGMMVVVYLLLEIGSAALTSGSQVDIQASLFPCAVKIACALIGGWLASRTPAVADDPVSLDKE